METAFASAAAGKANEMAKAFGFDGIGNEVHDIAKKFVGDYLHTF